MLFCPFYGVPPKRQTSLADPDLYPHPLRMFVVTEADAAAIRTAFDQEGELSAAIELRRRFHGITDNAKARAYVRTIVGWKPQPSPPCTVTLLRPGGVRSTELHSPASAETLATELPTGVAI